MVVIRTSGGFVSAAAGLCFSVLSTTGKSDPSLHETKVLDISGYEMCATDGAASLHAGAEARTEGGTSFKPEARPQVALGLLDLSIFERCSARQALAQTYGDIRGGFDRGVSALDSRPPRAG